MPVRLLRCGGRGPEKVRLQHPIAGGVGDVEERGGMLGDPCVGEHTVDPSEVGDNAPESGSDRGRVGDVHPVG